MLRLISVQCRGQRPLRNGGGRLPGAGGYNGIMKRRTGDPWMPAPAFSRTLRGLGVHLLVREVEASIAFHERVLGARVPYHDPDFAVVEGWWSGTASADDRACEGADGEDPPGGRWLLHAFHTYEDHPFARLSLGLARGEAAGDAIRSRSPLGLGIELRLHGCDPDRAADRARALGYPVLVPPSDRPHGLRETFLRDPDGYVWVPDVPLPGS